MTSLVLQSCEKENNGPDDLLATGATDPLTRSADGTEGGLTDACIDRIIDSLQALFPPSRTAWKTYFRNILCHATIVPSGTWTQALPFSVGAENRGDAAIACFTSIKAMSEASHLSYATTHLYHIFAKATGLIYTFEHMEPHRHKNLLIIFPLARYHLTNAQLQERLESLKSCYESGQVHHLVAEASALYACPTKQETISLPDSLHGSSLENQRMSSSDDLCVRIQQILLSESIADQDGRIAKRIIGEALHFTEKDGEETKLHQERQKCDLIEQIEYADGAGEPTQARPQYSAESTKQQKGREVGSTSSPSTSHVLQESHRRMFKNNTCATAQEPETLPTTNLLTGEISRDFVSLLSINGIGQREIPPSDSDSTDILPTELKRQELSPTHAMSTRELRGQAMALAFFLEKKVDNFPAYIVLLKQYDAQIVSAAVIATLVRKYFPGTLGLLHKPGAYCTRRCQEYARTAIPEEIMKLLHTYEALSYQEIDQLLYRQAQEEKAHGGSTPSMITSEGMANGAPCLPPSKGETWMDRNRAEALAVRIPQDVPDARVQGIRDVRQGHLLASVVDIHLEGVPWTITSCEDWLDYITSIRHLETLSSLERYQKPGVQ